MKQIKLRCVHCGEFTFYEGSEAYYFYERRVNSLLFSSPCLICDDEMFVVRVNDTLVIKEDNDKKLSHADYCAAWQE